MPIVYNKEVDAWELKDATTEEKESLIGIAKDMITDFFGETIADKIMESKFKKVDLVDMDTKDMGNA